MLPKILSLCSWFVINYLKDQEPKEKDIEYSQTLFAYDTLDIVHIFKANNGTFTTKLLKDDISVQVPIILHQDSALLESCACYVMHKKPIELTYSNENNEHETQQINVFLKF